MQAPFRRIDTPDTAPRTSSAPLARPWIRSYLFAPQPSSDERDASAPTSGREGREGPGLRQGARKRGEAMEEIQLSEAAEQSAAHPPDDTHSTQTAHSAPSHWTRAILVRQG